MDRVKSKHKMRHDLAEIPANDTARTALSVALSMQTPPLTLKQASRAIGRNDAYLHQYLNRGSPRHLPEAIRYQLAAILGVDQATLAHHDSLPKGARNADISHTATNSAPLGLQTMSSVPFLDIHASAGGGTLVDASADTATAALAFPRSWLRKISPSKTDALKLITISGDSMAPVLEHGDTVMLDTDQTRPTPPGIFILHDGLGLVAKRIELVPSTSPQTLRICSENQAYTNYQRTIDEVQIIGRVVWFARNL
ncbi:S24 family peptidase [Candidatus Puniceispirillum marinum]|uniref:Prophage MuMc02-like, peptidase, family S24 n=1 Tax=Puniceispirillum marinum (strain IMCC1322) TaxID=488538 RepID=D5BP57_PUNMI|nr:S24 family peptidase [Candidatus Puniceispirillum marinum]ADE40491.1 prophage MuMc02-like, peptidase, family S24 [Candidatus Puniceispirillum marinum IMCC1322]